MTALPAAAGVLKVQLNYILGGGGPAVNRLFFHYSGTAPTPAQANTFATAVRTAFTTNLASLLGTAHVLSNVFVEDLTSSTGAVGADTTSVAGTRAGVSVPGGATVMTQYVIARRYRGGKPKTFWPFGTANDLSSSSVWASGLLNSTGTNVTAFINAIIAAGWTGAGTITQVNVSYFSGFHVVTNPITGRARNVPTLRGTPVQDTISAVLVEQGIASQRRRNQV